MQLLPHTPCNLLFFMSSSYNLGLVTLKNKALLFSTLINVFFSKFKAFLSVLRRERRFGPSYVSRVAPPL